MNGKPGRNGHEYQAKCPRCRRVYKAFLDVEWTGRATHPPLHYGDCKTQMGYYNNRTCPRLEYDIVEGRI